jgi:hypothetical protein
MIVDRETGDEMPVSPSPSILSPSLPPPLLILATEYQMKYGIILCIEGPSVHDEV